MRTNAYYMSFFDEEIRSKHSSRFNKDGGANLIFELFYSHVFFFNQINK